ncbi:hypothetical protein [Zavarzinella formosa]|uniref:hypothetical protein n=1 Tax=Zavarzinella formosa TaxID=360055 RepID=UPI0002F27433|nr:hypothetical protein [Zavarzinella formosa]
MAGEATINGRQGVFFDSPMMRAMADRATIRSLSRCGAYVMTADKSSIRYTTKQAPAPAGQPPFARRSERFLRTTTNKKTGVEKTRAASPIKELIRFGYDPRSKSVVVGPEDFRNAATRGYKVPAALEEGATVTIRRRGKARRISIGRHPSVKPALKKVAPKFAGTFKGSIKRG